MTNRERALAIVKSDDERVEFICTMADAESLADLLAEELDAAERRGWIAALEWVNREVVTASGIATKIAELKAQETDR